MKRYAQANIGIIGLSLGCFLAFSSVTAASVAATSVTDWRALPSAQLYSDNASSLELRLALLDQAQVGSHVQIATFNFDYGTAVRQLATHMCMAEARGVQVELLADAKSGDRVSHVDAWDSTPGAKAVEEIYNLIAQCGVQVYIHNPDDHFVTILGSHLPNVFGVPDGSAVSVTTVLKKVKQMKSRLVQLMTPVLNKLGVRSNPAGILADIQSIALAFKDLSKVETSKGNIEVATANLAKSYKSLLTDSFWAEMTVEKMQVFTEALKNAILYDKSPGGLADVFLNIRRYNRLNHRKLFLVREPNGEGCAIIGGRNLGDHYLTGGAGHFHDGDVMVCSKIGDSGQTYLGEVEASFTELKVDTSDWMLGPDQLSGVRKVQPIQNYAYQFIRPQEILNPDPERSLPLGQVLVNFQAPHLLTSGWQPSRDAVRLALLRAITQEQKSIWIETAYAEFNGSVRRALEERLKQGVSVTIVTNGLFISDGPSKMIRLWMEPWNERMKSLYPEKFRVESATIEAGTMIHFKGAAFRCQKDFKGNHFRRYFIGSHNFHPRSGYSDKENALTWIEPTTTDCPEPLDDLQALRGGYYQELRKTSPVPLLSIYPSLAWEFYYAYRMKDDKLTLNLARALDRAIYHMSADGKGRVYWYPQELNRFITLIDEGGLRDLLGIFL